MESELQKPTDPMTEFIQAQIAEEEVGRQRNADGIATREKQIEKLSKEIADLQIKADGHQRMIDFGKRALDARGLASATTAVQPRARRGQVEAAIVKLMRNDSWPVITAVADIADKTGFGMRSVAKVVARLKEQKRIEDRHGEYHWAGPHAPVMREIGEQVREESGA